MRIKKTNKSKPVFWSPSEYLKSDRGSVEVKRDRNNQLRVALESGIGYKNESGQWCIDLHRAPSSFIEGIPEDDLQYWQSKIGSDTTKYDVLSNHTALFE